MADVTHAPDRSRFESGEAYLSYVRSDGALDIQHTIVPPELSGQGIGGEMVQEAVAFARAEGLEVVATCSYARAWLDKHPDA